jgi:hypothetical protein
MTLGRHEDDRGVIETSIEERVARVLWDSMVNDEQPSLADLDLYGYVDAARAAIQEVRRDDHGSE